MHDGIPDTAATKHYITEDKLKICNDLKNTIGPYITVADGRIMSPTKKAELPLPKEFTKNARTAYSYNNLKSGTLLSIGQLCDNDCIKIFSKYDVKIIKQDKIFIKGRRTENGLWNLPINGLNTTSDQQPTIEPHTHVTNGVIKLDTTKSELAQYYAD